ncbi:MAG: hypothetical protein L0154_17555 [Chloroflexi bacterium]|nr:hypothetical protein [Chloroflexota bacterium]
MFYDPAKTAHFKETLLTITGQAFAAGGYALEDDPLGQKRGLIRFARNAPEIADDATLRVGWQLVAFEQSPVARFRIELERLNAGANTASRTLSDVIWNDYDVRVLPSEDYWWEFKTGDELPHALAAAGKMVFAYGVPWLEMR